MANIKISELPAATFVSDSDLLPIVQSGVTKKVTPALLLEDIWAETTAINALVDGLIAAPTISLYTSSGTLFDTGTATTRRFTFSTDQNATYNPAGNKHDFRFNSFFNDVGGSSTQAGAFGMKANATGSNKLVAFNMFGTSTPSMELLSVDTVEANTRKIRLNSDGIYLSTEFASGSFLLSITNNGAVVSDSRPSVFGMEYAADYSAVLATRERSFADVGTVKLLRQDTNTWTTGTRPANATGRFGFNTTTSKFEGYNGTSWVDLS